jgi:hypothetical protein
MLWIVLAVLLLMWARGRTTSYTLSGLIRNLAGHRVGGGPFTCHSKRPAAVGGTVSSASIAASHTAAASKGMRKSTFPGDTPEKRSVLLEQ